MLSGSGARDKARITSRDDPFAPPRAGRRPLGRLWGHRLARVTAQRPPVPLPRRGIAEDEARHETEDRIVDLAALRDGEATAGAIFRQRVLPLPTVREALIGDTSDEARGSGRLHGLE